MQQFSDHDGKSKTSSAVDAEHYPDGDPQQNPERANNPSHAEIAALAYRIWEHRGRPAHSQAEDWAEAERQLIGTPEGAPDGGRFLEQSGSMQR
ncbi:MAG TPA: DUF2934 domain-containing protein [Bryobacteraceae bacterium]|nr:DUF2934 domain-containing protein [Bryobacteraceae bacterium]